MFPSTCILPQHFALDSLTQMHTYGEDVTSVSLTSGSYLVCPVYSSLSPLNPSLKFLPSMKLSSCALQQRHTTVIFISVLLCVPKSGHNTFRAGTLSVCFTRTTKAPAALINITTAVAPLESLNSYSFLQCNRFPVYGFYISPGMKLGRAEFVNVTCISQKLRCK